MAGAVVAPGAWGKVDRAGEVAEVGGAEPREEVVANARVRGGEHLRGTESAWPHAGRDADAAQRLAAPRHRGGAGGVERHVGVEAQWVACPCDTHSSGEARSPRARSATSTPSVSASDSSAWPSGATASAVSVWPANVPTVTGLPNAAPGAAVVTRTEPRNGSPVAVGHQCHGHDGLAGGCDPHLQRGREDGRQAGEARRPKRLARDAARDAKPVGLGALRGARCATGSPAACHPRSAASPPTP